MNATITDKFVSILAYITFGMFSIVWLIFANVTRRRISPFLSFNIYQAIFVSVIFAVISLIYGIAINLLSVVPIIGTLAKKFDIFFNATPMYFSCTISGLFVTMFLMYLVLMVLASQKPYVPIVSDIINSNFGG